MCPPAPTRVAQTMSTIPPGTWARVRLLSDCPGDGRRPHHPAEDTCRVQVTVVDLSDNGDHHVFALFKGGRQNTLPTPPGGLGIHRSFRPDELEVIPEPR